MFKRSLFMVVFLMSPAHAETTDDLQRAADTAEVYVLSKGAKDEGVLKALSDPDQYAKMAEERAADPAPAREDLRVDDVEVTQIGADRAVARTTYSKIHHDDAETEEVYLIKRDGQWQITAPPEPAK